MTKPNFFKFTKNNILLFLPGLIFISLHFNCSKEEAVVAKFGKHKITLTQFRTAYIDIIKQPTVFDSKKLREEFVDELIQRRLLAEQAEKMGLGNDERLQYRIEAYRDKCLRNAHFEQVIKPDIHTTEDETEQTYLYTQEQRQIRHLFTETKEQAEALYQRLEQGVAFEDLAAIVFNDSALAQSSGDLGWVQWEQLEYDLAMAAFKQPLHEYSKPIKSQFGYHIIQVINFKKNPMITRQQYELHRNKAKYLLESKKGEKTAGEYIREMMKDVDIQVRPAVMQQVGDRLVRILNRKPAPTDQMNEMQLSEEEMVQLETNLWDIRHDVLAELNGKELTVGEFISALNYIPYDVIYKSYKSTLDFAFRDFVLTTEAREMGLASSPDVKLKTNLYEEYLLQSKLRRRLVKNTTVTEQETRSYYDDNKSSKYRNAPYDSVKNIIKEQLLIAKQQQAIPGYLEELSSDLEIEKYPELIHEYYDSVKFQKSKDKITNKSQ